VMTDRKILVLGASGLIGRFVTGRSDPDAGPLDQAARRLGQDGPAIVL